MQNTHYLELLFVFLDMSCKAHWEKIYKEKSSQEVSWTQETPTTSIDFFSDFKIQKDDPIIDVGCGESKFVDYLIVPKAAQTENPKGAWGRGRMF